MFLAQICPSQLALCPACGCLVGQQSILFKSLHVQVWNLWLSPCKGYLLPRLCTSLQSVASCPHASLWESNQPQSGGRYPPPPPGPPLRSCLLCTVAHTRVEVLGWSLIKWYVGLAGYLIVISVAVARKKTVTYQQKNTLCWFFLLEFSRFLCYELHAAACTKQEDLWLVRASTDHTEY